MSFTIVYDKLRRIPPSSQTSLEPVVSALEEVPARIHPQLLQTARLLRQEPTKAWTGVSLASKKEKTAVPPP